jgi:Domain of unknown function (DUF1893)
MVSETTLELVLNGEVLFASKGKWLHPLFELEQFLKTRQVDLGRAQVRDKIVGRGSAFLMVRMGIRAVRAGVLSRMGKDVLDRAGVACGWETLVDKIQCRTEGLLRDTTDPEQAYLLLADLARKDRLPHGGESIGPSSAPPAPRSLPRGRSPAA